MKLYIVVLSALGHGLKAAQACHAVCAFGAAYPHIYEFWYHESNNIVVLQEDDVPSLADRLEKEGLRVARFHEPDLDGALTAICIEPNGQRFLSSLPLAA